MGLFDRLLGRSTPPAPDLDALFALPSAALSLEAAMGLRPTGVGSVCYRAAEGAAFSQLQVDVQALLDASGGPKVEAVADSYGYTWLVVRRGSAEFDDLPGLVTDLHAVNVTLRDAGFGPSLLCSLVGFSDGTRSLGLVYLYKQGTFYPFAPRPGAGEQRDSVLELQVRDTVAGDLRVEPDLARWFPVWGAPGL